MMRIFKTKSFCFINLLQASKMLLIFFISAVAIFGWLLNRWKTRAFVSLAQKVPSNKFHTMIGCGPLINLREVLTYSRNYAEKYGPNSVIWQGPYPFFQSCEPQILMEVLTSKNCLDKPSLIYDGFSKGIKKGLITENGATWNRHRKLLNKAFSNNVILSYFSIFYKAINNVTAKIDKSIEKGETIDMLEHFREFTLKNASLTILKRNIELTEFNVSHLASQLNCILLFLGEMCCNVIFRIDIVCKLAYIFKFKKANKALHTFERFIIQSLDIAQRNDTSDSSYYPETKGVVDFGIAGIENNIINMTEIQEEMTHLFAAAFDTTSSTLFFVLTLLAMHPKYQDRVYDEISNILSYDESNEFTLEQLNQLVYLDMVLNETLRLMPAVPLVFRKLTNENLTLSNGITLPKGQLLAINIYLLHRNKAVWGPEADLFNPDNFLPSNITSRHPYSFIPFTKGQRFCIGVKYAQLFVKVSLAKLIKTYRFSTDFKYENLKVICNLTLHLAEKPILCLERRKV